MKAEKIAENIYWVGGIDWKVREFHGYVTEKGSSYNAFLIIDEKITLIDTVKGYLADEMMQRISSVIDPAKIDYVIVNHVEMDHSGAMPVIMEKAKNATIVTCPNGEKGLKIHYRKEWNYKIVKTGDSLNTGKYNFDFVQTPMVHWPDNMVTYLREEKILFSNDAFGQHLATSERFDDEYSLEIIMEQARKYYANIVLPFAGPVNKALAEAAKLDIALIATSHGIMWRKNIPLIIEEYKKMAANQTVKKAVIVYDTMWASTEKMAYTIGEVFEGKGYEIRMMSLGSNHNSNIMTEILDAEYICVGSPTLNNNILPTVASFLTYLKGLAPKGRKGVAFGSYGWSGESVGQVSEMLKSSNIEIIDQIKFQYVPFPEDLEVIAKNLSEKI